MSGGHPGHGTTVCATHGDVLGTCRCAQAKERHPIPCPGPSRCAGARGETPVTVPVDAGPPVSGAPFLPRPEAQVGAQVWVVLLDVDRLGSEPEVYDVLCEHPEPGYLDKLREALRMTRHPMAEATMAIVPMGRRGL